MLDIRLVVEPLLTARAALQCSETELTRAAEERQSNWEFDTSTRFISQHVVVRSDDARLFGHGEEVTTNFAILTYRLAVRSPGNALSVVATYPFSSMAMSMSLTDEQTGDVIQLERTSSLEGEGPAPRALSTAHDMATFAEVPELDAGQYRLEIALQRSLFLPTHQYPTCLSFDLVVEYVVRSHGRSAGDGMYEVLSVRPLTLEQLQATDEKVIEVDFDKEIVLDDMVHGLADRYYVCQLVNKGDSANIIHPHSVREETRSSLRLDFDFSKARIPTTSRCYSLKCSTKETKGTEVIRPMQEETSYCFESNTELEHDVLAHCNPLA